MLSLANRIFQNRFLFQNFADFTELLTSRNQTRGHIQRALFHLLLDIQEPVAPALFLPQYTRILGMRRKSSQILRMVKSHSDIPVLTKMADAPKNILDFPFHDEERKKLPFANYSKRHFPLTFMNPYFLKNTTSHFGMKIPVRL